MKHCSREIIRLFSRNKLSIYSTVILLILGSSQQKDTLSGTIIDSQTKNPLPYTHIYIKNSTIGTTSNLEGRFNINSALISQNDTIVISYIGYLTQQIPARNLKGIDGFIYLEKYATELKEVVITNLSAREIVKRAIDSIPTSYLRNIQNYGFYRTASQENGVYCRLLESFVRVQSNDKVDYMNIMKSDDFRSYHADESNSLEEALDFDHIKELRGFLNLSNGSDWKYNIVGYTLFENESVYVIEAKYIASDDLKHVGKLYISGDFVILKIEYDYQWEPEYSYKRLADSLELIPTRWKGIFNYGPAHDKYCLNYFSFSHQNRLLDLKNKKWLLIWR